MPKPMTPSPEFKAHIFKPGQSGNTAGSLSKDGITQWIRKLADEMCNDCDLSLAERVGRKVYQMAIAGNLKAIRLILDRIEPAQTGVGVQVNTFLVRQDLNERLDAFKDCDVERLLPVEFADMPVHDDVEDRVANHTTERKNDDRTIDSRNVETEAGLPPTAMET